MKTHSVKSNAKRAARKLVEQFPGLVAVEPLAVDFGGPWHALVAAADGFDPRTLPAGTFADVQFIAADGRVGAPAPLPSAEPVPPAILDTPAGRVADAETVEAAKLAQAGEPALQTRDMMLASTSQLQAQRDAMKANEPAIAAAFAKPDTAKTKALKESVAAVMSGEPDPHHPKRAAKLAQVDANLPTSLMVKVPVGNGDPRPSLIDGQIVRNSDGQFVPAKPDTAALVKTLPPRVKSTPEEVAARREERRKRIDEAKANPTPTKPKMGGVIVALCAREGGATSAALMAATGWQAHTLRGYIAGTLRKRGHRIELVKTKGEASRYVIAKAEPEAPAA